MPLVTTNISYEYEEGGRGEYSTFSREVADIDVNDWLWYLVKVTEMAGFDCKQLQLISSRGTIYKTDI